MDKNKPRSYKNSMKLDVLYSTQPNYPNFERSKDGSEWCHEQYHPRQVYGKRIDQNGKLLCKGNRFNCLKQKYKWWTSLSERVKNKYKQWWSK